MTNGSRVLGSIFITLSILLLHLASAERALGQEIAVIDVAELKNAVNDTHIDSNNPDQRAALLLKNIDSLRKSSSGKSSADSKQAQPEPPSGGKSSADSKKAQPEPPVATHIIVADDAAAKSLIGGKDVVVLYRHSDGTYSRSGTMEGYSEPSKELIKQIRGTLAHLENLNKFARSINNSVILTRQDLESINWILWVGGGRTWIKDKEVNGLQGRLQEFFEPLEKEWFLNAVVSGMPLLVTGLEGGDIDITVLRSLKTSRLPSLGIDESARGFFKNLRELAKSPAKNWSTIVTLRVKFRSLGFAIQTKEWKKFVSNVHLMLAPEDGSGCGLTWRPSKKNADTETNKKASDPPTKKAAIETNITTNEYLANYESRCHFANTKDPYFKLVFKNQDKAVHRFYSVQYRRHQHSLTVSVPQPDNLYFSGAPSGRVFGITVPVLSFPQSNHLTSHSFLRHELNQDSTPLRHSLANDKDRELANDVFSIIDDCAADVSCDPPLSEIRDYLFIPGRRLKLPEDQQEGAGTESSSAASHFREMLTSLQEEAAPLAEILDVLWARLNTATELYRGVAVRLVNRRLAEKLKPYATFDSYFESVRRRYDNPRLEYLIRGLKHQKTQLDNLHGKPFSLLPGHPCPEAPRNVNAVELVARDVFDENELDGLEIEIIPSGCPSEL